MSDKVEKVRKVTSKDTKLKLAAQEEELKRVAPNKERFDNLLQAPKTEKVVTEQRLESSRKTSLMDESRELNTKYSKPKVTPSELIAQTEQTVKQIDVIKEQLQNPDLQLKSSVNGVLRNKLSHVDENIRMALSRTGTEGVKAAQQEPPPIGPKENPISRFLGLLTDGQSKLQTLASEVQTMALNKDGINPASLLLIQIKVGYIQQELEFFSGVLNKALESTKTIMNVQV
jgi:hypothetical protein